MSSIYTKSKTTVSNVSVVADRVVDENTSMKVSFNPDQVNLIIEYLTNLYANAPVAVVRELFTNAADADPKGIIEIDIENIDYNDNTLIIKDNGCGMSKKELEENYIQYANSSKMNDFDTVGSFGLGSKSPMAITSEYRVSTSNGEEYTEAIVQRIESGIFAEVTSKEPVEDTFTKVSVYHINDADLLRMNTYIQFLANYSGRQIILNGNILRRSEGCEWSCKLPSEVYDIRLFTSKGDDTSRMKVLANYYRNGSKNFNVIFRVNNTPYKVRNAEGNRQGSILIDVEPGYFAFAPSREEIPDGDKKDHILDIVSECVFDYPSSFISFVSDNDFVDDKVIFDVCCSKYIFNDEDLVDCLANVSIEEADSLREIWNVRNATEKAEGVFDRLFKDCEIRMYTKDSFNKMRIDSWDVIEPKELMKLVSDKMTSPIKKFDYDTCKSIQYTKVFVNAKKKRDGSYRDIPGYGVSVIAYEIRQYAEDNHLFRRVIDSYRTRGNQVSAIQVFTDKSKLPDEAMEYLKCINLYADEAMDPELRDVATITPDYNEELKPKRPRVEFEDKLIEYTESAFYKKTIQVKNLLESFNPDRWAVVTNREFLRSDFTFYFDYKFNKKFVYFYDDTKRFARYLEESGFEILDYESSYNSDLGRCEFTAKNDSSKKYVDILNKGGDLFDVIEIEEPDTILACIAMDKNVSNLAEYMSFDIPENITPGLMNVILRSRKLKKYSSDSEYMSKFFKSFDAEKYYKKNKKTLTEHRKYVTLQDIPAKFHDYFGNPKEADYTIPIDDWRGAVYALVHDSKEYRDFIEKMDGFTQLSFYEFKSYVLKGLNMDNPIHKLIYDTMEAEVIEYFGEGTTVVA